MTRTALILGANGRFGRHSTIALERHGWTTRAFDRRTDTLPGAAKGADLIVYGWNVPYSQWAATVPGLTAQVIEAARVSGATVVIPGNVYVYGRDLPGVLGPETPHRATHPLGRIRRELEDAYRRAGVRTIILRAGDYIDVEASGNWFDRMIATKVGKGRVSYPGPLDVEHAWAFLPDLAEALARLVERMDALPTFSEHLFDGYTMTGRQLAAALSEATGRPVTAARMAWLPILVAQPFWAEAKHFVEMRYLWQRPHRLDGSGLASLIGEVPHTPLTEALRQAVRPML